MNNGLGFEDDDADATELGIDVESVDDGDDEVECVLKGFLADASATVDDEDGVDVAAATRTARGVA